MQRVEEEAPPSYSPPPPGVPNSLLSGWLQTPLHSGWAELSENQYDVKDRAPVMEEISPGVCDLFLVIVFLHQLQNKPAAPGTGMAAVPDWHQTSPGTEGVALQEGQSDS